jgi:lipopolysaccharide heptosyltransferase I
VARQAFLLIRLGSLGDIVHGIPAAAALRQRYPDARIDWLVDPKYVGLLELVDGLDAPVPFDPRGLVRGGAAWATLGRLRAARYDAVVDLQGLLKSAVVARLTGGARVVGFPRGHLRERAARIFYTETPDPGPAAHVIHKNLALLRALGVEAGGIRFPLREVQSALAAAVRARFAPDGYALLNPGAAWPNKRWPPARFGAVAAAIRREVGLRSLVMWGPGEEPLAAEVVAASDGAAEASPETTITDIVAIVRGARLMVSGDTGPLHIGGALGVPLVALFGPTLPARNGPWDARDAVLSRVEQCGCVYERQCRRTERCIDDIGVDEVLAAVRRRLGGQG